MRVLHTSDWHLGRSLETFKRYEEFESFLGWLTQTIIDRQVDALVVAGDVFDNTAPPNRAQELYYRFLAGLAGSCCHHVIIVAGNHDSPSFLDAPREILRAISVHVIGAAGENPEDEVITLKNRLTGEPLAVVCAVPYLRDRDIRSVEAGETIEEK
ncbi:MAG TPA: exonuclease subunit SbcD, partial [Candidatus Rifleibacterium sp.]|nr:exonuclease subunit SbcD [Candidatus Rifleibacterium sp.]